MQTPKFFIEVLILATGVMLFTLFAPMATLVLSGSNFLHFYSNVFFVNITAMGDGIFAFALVIFIVFGLNKKRMGAQLLINVLISLALVQAVKNIFSTESMLFYIEELRPVTQNIISSHTVMAFTLATFFALRTKNYFVKAFLFIVATTVGFCQLCFAAATLQAVMAGIFTGSFSAILVRRFSSIRFTKKDLLKGKTLNRGSGLFSPAT